MLNELIDNKDYTGIQNTLSAHPALANEGIPFNEVNTVKAHPLHRICDRVFSKDLTDEEAVTIAKIFIAHGANVDGGTMTDKTDTPLIAAASLNADALAFLYIDHGADMHHAGTHGGTALHWAAWCGRDKLIERLLAEGADINRLCNDFKATPLFWAVQGYHRSGKKNPSSYLECARLLLQAGADRSIPNAEGNTIFDLLYEQDLELKDLLLAGTWHK